MRSNLIKKCRSCGKKFSPIRGREETSNACSKKCAYSLIRNRTASKEYKREAILKRVIKDDAGCWNWSAARDKNGYGKMSSGSEYSKYAHRVSYDVFVGTIPKGINVCHKCDNPSCVNPEHLFLGTQKDNIHDMHSKGRGIKSCEWTWGEKHKNSKLTEQDVIMIYGSDLSSRELANLLNVSSNLIVRIRAGKTWKHLFSSYHKETAKQHC